MRPAASRTDSSVVTCLLRIVAGYADLLSAVKSHLLVVQGPRLAWTEPSTHTSAMFGQCVNLRYHHIGQ